ncbi:hypothetical protein JCM19232_5043 [Vibrio ishigakensis]|uniref:Uncharacterized protein n=1 Tax=Vibrio ishigakensis TaxID=1481914 RepID=A0A0B8PH04_9VIBR|nr:hypothetical protein JCM19232_5043 [Vibrio ishigakensis]
MAKPFKIEQLKTKIEKAINLPVKTATKESTPPEPKAKENRNSNQRNTESFRARSACRRQYRQSEGGFGITAKSGV